MLCGDAESYCFPICDVGSYISGLGSVFASDCQNAHCELCRPDDWCDGTHPHDCPDAMRSPLGSAEEGNCTCHGGHVRNGTTCTVCPEGSWCDQTDQYICPDGTTSNLVSRSEEDCYCLDGYTGDVDCSTRTNITHHPCDAGYAIVESDDGCQLCGSGSWCDGTDHFQCPMERVASFANSGAKRIDDCFCPLGFSSESSGSQVCVACPERSLSNFSARGYFDPNCIPPTTAEATTTPTPAVVATTPAEVATTPTPALVTTTPAVVTTTLTPAIIGLIIGGVVALVACIVILIVIRVNVPNASHDTTTPIGKEFFQGVKIQMSTGVGETLYDRI
jgi:hypothetical protein